MKYNNNFIYIHKLNIDFIVLKTYSNKKKSLKNTTVRLSQIPIKAKRQANLFRLTLFYRQSTHIKSYYRLKKFEFLPVKSNFKKPFN